ncbi:MAG: DUF3307 domain-containing protein [Bacteroidaceae bacterium]|nr:DUF3307 domain-containing protein [Bacteroidaceae bacterium]
MMTELFLSLVLAHLVADFVLQTGKTCKDKKERNWRSPYHYVHALIVFGLAWLVSWDVCFWWGALVIGFSHFAVDMFKSYHEENVKWFAADQLLHLAVLALISWIWISEYRWNLPFCVTTKEVTMGIAIIACWKPANIFIKLMLRHCSVSMPEEKASSFNAGSLIGNIERWLILLFVILQRFDAIGLLIAAKSIIRFGDKETAKTEYVLAGTLMSILIAVLAGMMVVIVEKG